MPHIAYTPKRFNASSQRVIDQANVIISDYRAQGYTLTLRQLYYQFVARDLSANTMKDYKRIGSIINDGRLAGLIDWEAIEDRTRNLESPSTWNSPADIIETCAKTFKYDWWLKQPVRIEIWVEKEALVGVIERVAGRYRVPYFACRGNVSQSELWRAGVRMKEYYEDFGQPVKVLHLGDHDPSGIDMTRDNIARLELFGEGADIEVKRLALNFDQVKQYRPPPNPAKMTDSRAAGYVKKFGNQSWELDALSPKVIEELIQEAIADEIDGKAWAASKRAEEKARAELQDVADNWENE